MPISGPKPKWQRCKTQLPKDLAEEMILNVIGEKILASAPWFSTVWAACQQAWKVYCNTVPVEIQETERQLAETDRKLSRLVDRIEVGDDSPDIAQRRMERQAEQVSLNQRLKKLRADALQYPQEPSETWLRQQLVRLGETLREGTPAAALALRTLLGGKIIVKRVQKPTQKSFFWRGTFQLSAHTTCQALGVIDAGRDQSHQDSSGEMMTLDFVAHGEEEELMRCVRELYEQEYLGVEISQRFGISRGRVTTLLQRSFALEGKEMPDGRKHRHELKRKTMLPGMPERLSQPAKELWDQDLPMLEIAKRLRVDKNHVTQAIQFWFESRGLPVPDGRSRRLEIRLKGQSQT